MEQNTMGALEIITIVLSVVALTITIVGFFASLRFYRDGMEMQSHADRVLAKIEERASAIQTQVGGIFDKTLDAALGRSSPREAEEQQSRMLKRSRDRDTANAPGAADTGPPTGSDADKELAQKVFQYYAFRKFRVTDVTNSTAKAVFNLGSSGGFNLLDGIPGTLFLGYFMGVAPAEIVARARILFTNFEILYSRLDDIVDPALRDQAKRILDQISIDIFVDESVNAPALAESIEQFQPTARAISVEIRTPGEITEAVAEEFRRMEPSVSAV